MLPFILTALLLAHTPPITVAVAPLVCAAPCDVRVTVSIEPNGANRWFVVQMDAASDCVGTCFQGTMKQLDGDKSPKTQPAIWFKEMGRGVFEVTVTLYRNQGRTEAGRVTATVLIQ